MVTARHVAGDGAVTFSIGPVDVPPRSRRSCGTMPNVPERDVEHVDSLICRRGEASLDTRLFCITGSCVLCMKLHPTLFVVTVLSTHSNRTAFFVRRSKRRHCSQRSGTPARGPIVEATRMDTYVCDQVQHNCDTSSVSLGGQAG